MIKQLKHFVRGMPLVDSSYWRYRNARSFPGSDSYWERRYAAGGNSGAGSYGRLAHFKAQFINDFVKEQAIQSVIELGCGDGHQVSLAKYPSYVGLDVSATAIELCSARFGHDMTKSFFQYNPKCFVDRAGIFRAQLALSLDVIYHLVEDEIYWLYMTHLFGAAERYVIVYSSNTDCRQQLHERHRRFTDWVTRNEPQWKLKLKCDNPYPYNPADAQETSLADFYVFERP